MEITRTGIILNTEHYDDCVAFYRELLGLPVLFQEQYDNFRLTCFEFNDSYLMVETGGFAKSSGKSIRENAAKLRFNVTNLEHALRKITDYGIQTEISKHGWGMTIDIFDPDGNRVGIRDEASFAKQIGS